MPPTSIDVFDIHFLANPKLRQKPTAGSLDSCEMLARAVAEIQGLVPIFSAE